MGSMGRHEPGSLGGCFCKERGWLAEGHGMGGYAHVGLRVGCEQRRTLSRHCNAVHRCLLTLLLHLRDTCCLAKGDLNVQHLKEVHPLSGWG